MKRRTKEKEFMLYVTTPKIHGEYEWMPSCLDVTKKGREIISGLERKLEAEFVEILELKEAIQEFVDRCECGEGWRNPSYDKLKDLLDEDR